MLSVKEFHSSGDAVEMPCPRQFLRLYCLVAISKFLLEEQSAPKGQFKIRTIMSF